jgi:hypothetical protein
MSEYLFGVGSKRIPPSFGARVDEIAQRHGCDFVWVRLAEGPRYWFAGPNRGSPFDGQMAAAVWADLQAAGLADAKGLRIPGEVQP